MEPEVVDQEDQAAQAAFAASANDEVVVPKKEPEPVVEVTPEPEVKVEEAASAPSPVTLSAEEYAELRSMVPKVNEFQGELRKAHGRIGALNDQLHQAMKTKEAEGKPAVLTSIELKRMKENFPELSATLSEDLAELFASQAPKSEPVDYEAIIAEKMQKERETLAAENLAERQQLLKDEHPDAAEMINSPEFAAWRGTLTTDQVNALEQATSPYLVSKKLTIFKEWRDKSIKAKEQSKKRLEAAVTPTSVALTSQHVLSDREAAEKAFAAQIN